MCPCVQDRIGIWKCWFLRRGEKRSTWRKTSEQRREPTTNATHIWRRRRDLNPEASDFTTAPPLLVSYLFLFSATGGENERSSSNKALDLYVLSESSPFSDNSRFHLRSNLATYKTEGKDLVHAVNFVDSL